MFLVSRFGIGAFLLALIPMVAAAPILVCIGVVTCNQVVREAPRNEVPVIFITMFPWIADWALTLPNNTLSAAGTAAKTLGGDALASKGVSYQDLSNLGDGAPLSSMTWGCIAIFPIDDQPIRGALLTILGVVHAPSVGFVQPQAMPIVCGYCMIAGIFALTRRLDQREEKHAPLGSAEAAE